MRGVTVPSATGRTGRFVRRLATSAAAPDATAWPRRCSSSTITPPSGPLRARCWNATAGTCRRRGDDGTTGIDAARALQPDVVLLDVRLPDIDGFAVAERLTANGGGPAVIVTSSSDDPLYPDRALRTGACGFVAKHDLSGAALQRLLDAAGAGAVAGRRGGRPAGVRSGAGARTRRRRRGGRRPR